MNVKKMLVSGTAVLATLAMAGCGTATSLSGGRSGATLTRATFASAVTAATSDARSVHMVTELSGSGHHATMTSDMSLGGGTSAPSVSLKDLTMSMTMSLAGVGTAQMRIVGGVVYVNTAGLPISSRTTKPWVKFDLNDPQNPLGPMLSQLTGDLSPAQLAKAFQALSTLTTVGPETVDGVQTTHYKVTVDTAKASALLGIPKGSAAPAMPRMLTYDVWVDAASRPVKVAFSMMGVSLQMHFSKWGQPVHIVAPPASQVGTLSH